MSISPSWLAAAALTALAAPGLAQTAVPTVLTVSAEAEVTRAPDQVEIGGGVVTRAPTAAEALAANARAMTAALATLKKAGVADRDVQTSGLNLQPQFRYDDKREPVLTGYQVSNSVNIRLRDVERAGPVIDALVSAGVNQVNGPRFGLADPESALDEARAAAVKRARERAALYARAAGMKLGRIISITEGGVPAAPEMRPMMRSDAIMVTGSRTPVAPGELELAASVRMEFQLDPIS